RAIAQNISLQAVWQFGNAFECILPLPVPTKEYTAYGCYCGLSSWIPFLEDLDPCCRARDNCYAQVDYLGNCALLIRNPYTSSYSYSCSGTEITCSDKNKLCEAFICNCDQQAAICFSKIPYTKQYRGIYC
ncbi:phospholipase A2, partial [Cricetulus griseus]|uniref:phospholipase A2 n=1 Tax=Cricetulus griseus TaxID=10029 RepID=UPI000454205F